MAELVRVLLNVAIVLRVLSLVSSHAIHSAHPELDDDENILDLSEQGELYDKSMEAYNPNTTTLYPEEMGPYFQGDIYPMRGFLKNGHRSPVKRWPNGVVPYKIDSHFRKKQVDIIKRAFRTIQDWTCVRFKKRRNEKDYVFLQDSFPNCFSAVGRSGGMQFINLQSKCMNYGTILHELMHTIGFFHEHSRYDRDDYIRVLKENIEPEKLAQFNKLDSQRTNTFDVEYNYGSILHYGPYSFSKNKQPTLKALKPLKRGVKMGQRSKLSGPDILKINRMYNCNSK